MEHLFSSCPHDNMHDPEKWVALMQRLITSCDLDLGYERFSDFQLAAGKYFGDLFERTRQAHRARWRTSARLLILNSNPMYPWT